MEKVYIFCLCLCLCLNFVITGCHNDNDVKIQNAQFFFTEQDVVVVADVEEMRRRYNKGLFAIIYKNYSLLRTSSISHSIKLSNSKNYVAKAYAYRIIIDKLCGNEKAIEKYIFPVFSDTSEYHGVIAGGRKFVTQLNNDIFMYLFVYKEQRCYDTSKQDSLKVAYKLKPYFIKYVDYYSE